MVATVLLAAFLFWPLRRVYAIPLPFLPMGQRGKLTQYVGIILYVKFYFFRRHAAVIAANARLGDSRAALEYVGHVIVICVNRQLCQKFTKHALA
jgi:hypothetical protein